MLGIVYLIVCFIMGAAVTSAVFGKQTDKLVTFKGKETGVSSFFFRIPLWFVTGTLINTWAVYILACIFRNGKSPLFLANMIVTPVSLAVSVLLLFRRIKDIYGGLKQSVKNIKIVEIIVFVFVIAIFSLLFYKTLYFSDGRLHVGLSVFSDFSTHLSMMRSFSHGSNFPTQYTFYAGQDVKYHFMFQFLCGNLEYLGLRTDHAMNIPSLLGILSAYMTFYALTVKITGKRAAGFLAMLLLTFRSSFSFFIYAGQQKSGKVLTTLSERAKFIGSTNHEDWGLWNLNVYCNQRHFAFCLTIAMIVLILMLPPVFEAFRRLSVCRKNRRIRELQAEGKGSKELKCTDKFYADVSTYLYDSLVNKEGWLIKDIKTPVFAGILLGMSGFWNGAVLLAVIMVLFFLAVISDRRLEFLIMAGIAGILSLIQSKVFISDGLFTFNFYYGFLSDNTTLAGSLVYLIKLSGILTIVLLIAFVLAKGHYKYLMFCFSIPILFAFNISLTPDIAVNHKYVMFSIMLLNIPAADFFTELFSKKNVWMRILIVLSVFVMTVTGIFEFEILTRMNDNEKSFSYAQKDSLMEWVWENADRDDIFLTANYFLSAPGAGSSLVLSGCKLFNGWQYYSWSAGYDTKQRDTIMANIYSAENPEELMENLKDTGIRYIVVEARNRTAEEYELNEEVIAGTFEKVYSEGEGKNMVSIYDTKLILPQKSE